LNNQVNALSEAQGLQTRELAKHQLKPLRKDLNTPVIDHWVLQLHGVAPHLLDDPRNLEEQLSGAVKSLELTEVSSHSHYFGPGVSTVIILSESHLSAHTWPELGYIHMDIVTCVKKLTREKLEAEFQRRFKGQFIQLVQLEY